MPKKCLIRILLIAACLAVPLASVATEGKRPPEAAKGPFITTENISGKESEPKAGFSSEPELEKSFQNDSDKVKISERDKKSKPDDGESQLSEQEKPAAEVADPLSTISERDKKSKPDTGESQLSEQEKPAAEVADPLSTVSKQDKKSKPDDGESQLSEQEKPAAEVADPLSTQESDVDDISGEFGEQESDTNLGGDEFAESESFDRPLEVAGLKFTGFVETEMAGRFGTKGAQERDWIMNNIRFRLKTIKHIENIAFSLKLDFISDQAYKTQEIDVREAKITYTPFSWMDINLGRQILNWGVGDMIFVNDLFPKDCQAYFIGRSIDDVPKSSNALKVTSYFSDNSGLDVVYHPEFHPHHAPPHNCRLPVYDPNTREMSDNSEYCREMAKPPGQGGEYSNGEVAARLFVKAGYHDLALYTYSGYFKTPKSMKPSGSGDPLRPFSPHYPRLNVYGASAEGQLYKGIYSFEYGYYESREDKKGKDPFIKNSSHRILLGYRLKILENIELSWQLYQVRMIHFDNYEQGLKNMVGSMMASAGAPPALIDGMVLEDPFYKYREERVLNTYTFRLKASMMNETLWFNLFFYERPQDHDRYIRMSMDKQINNILNIALGANIFSGDENYVIREFAMQKDSDNAFVRFQYIF